MYHSASYAREWDDVTGEVYAYSYNYDFANTSGTVVEYGDGYTFLVRLTGGGAAYETNPTVPLRTQVVDIDQPYACDTYDSPEYSATTCSSYLLQVTSKGGYHPETW